MVKRSSFQIFLAVQNALFLRELSMRFSEGRMGLFWTFVEPFFQILIFIVIKVALFSSAQNDFDFSVFLALNFIAFNLFKNIVTKSSNAFEANKALFTFKQVKPIDTIIARLIVEVFITAIITCIFIVIGLYFDFDMDIQDLSMVSLGFIFLLFFSFSFALVISIMNVFISSVGKLLSFLMTGLMFGSAVFYPIKGLPTEIQNFLLYNPLTHFLEMIHCFYFVALDDEYISYHYMLVWTLSLCYIGLWLYSKFEKKIISL